MSDLEISKKTVHDIFSGKVDFLIPDYQRPYSWERDQRDTLWEDLKSFAFPEDREFDDDNDEYFLGAIVTFRHDKNDKTNEVIDGQQRLITLMLLLRAFYAAFGNNANEDDIAKEIAKCIWRKKDGKTDKNSLKIHSEVATDDDLAELKKIITDGEATTGNKSFYAENYCYFQEKIKDFKISTPQYFALFPSRILENCIIMPIETSSQATAFRIFTTLNDRGMQLSDSDIFKSQFYKFFRAKGDQARRKFVERWKKLEELCAKNFHPRTGTPTDDLFMRYMYYLMAQMPKRSNTFHNLRDFYEPNNYKILRNEKTFEDLETLAIFWEDITQRNDQRFSSRVLKRLYVLSYSPYAMWGNIVSLYFMGNRDSQNRLDDEKFYHFLDKITAMFLMYAVAQPGVQAIRRPFFLEFQNILYGRELSFAAFVQNKKFFHDQLFRTKFSQTKPITRAMLIWWMFQDEKQGLPPLDTRLEIEHIYAKNRANFQSLENPENLELLGNKALLEKRINIRASDYRFADKKKYYTGYRLSGKLQPATDNVELIRIAQTHSDFKEPDILERNEEILNGFMNYLDENNLLR